MPVNQKIAFGPATDPEVDNSYDSWLHDLMIGFDAGAEKLNAGVKEAYDQLKAHISDPSVLALYQAALSDYTLYRNAQSTSVKVMKDTDSGIISNFR